MMTWLVSVVISKRKARDTASNLYHPICQPLSESKSLEPVCLYLIVYNEVWQNFPTQTTHEAEVWHGYILELNKENEPSQIFNITNKYSL